MLTNEHFSFLKKIYFISDLKYYIYSMLFKILILILFLMMILWFTIFACFLLLWPIITGFKKAPYVPSFRYHLNLMKKHLQLEKWAKIVDLWCGDGKALRFFTTVFWLQGTWYDLNPFVIHYGRVLDLLLWFRDIVLIRSNFTQAQLKEYTYVYLYLWPEQMISIEDRVFEHVSKNTVIISNSFTFIKHKSFDSIHDEHGKKVIYLYRK